MDQASIEASLAQDPPAEWISYVQANVNAVYLTPAQLNSKFGCVPAIDNTRVSSWVAPPAGPPPTDAFNVAMGRAFQVLQSADAQQQQLAADAYRHVAAQFFPGSSMRTQLQAGLAGPDPRASEDVRPPDAPTMVQGERFERPTVMHDAMRVGLVM